MMANSNNPYIGPRTFQKDEGHLFFGREIEERDLLALVSTQRLVLFYAQSGTGKSSLVNTRLIPGLEGKGYEVLPVGRVSGGAFSSELAADNIYTYHLMLSLLRKDTEHSLSPQLTLSGFFDGLDKDENGYFYNDAPLPEDAGEGEYLPLKHALIIDQFEELFRTHPEAWEKREDFFRQIAQVMEDDPFLWVVLVMREDFIANLDPYAHLLPGELRVRYYMQRLERDAALRAVKGPVIERQRPYADGVAEKLVDDLSRSQTVKADGELGYFRGQYVEPIVLQAVCYRLWEKLPEEGLQITDVDLQTAMVDVDQALGDYFAERVRSIAQGELTGKKRIREREIRNWFEKALITESGTRNKIAQGIGKMTGGMDDEIVQEFIRLGDLVRAEKSGSGSIFYELTHDRLVEPILANNTAWRNRNTNLLQQGAALWGDRGRSEGLLLRGKELKDAETWAKANNEQLSPIEDAYLEASLKLKLRDDRERGRNRLIAGLAVIATIAMFASFVLFRSSKTSEQYAQQSLSTAEAANTKVVQSLRTAQASDQMANEQLQKSEGLRLAIQAGSLLSGPEENPEQAALLSIRALQAIYVSQADQVLQDTLNRLFVVGSYIGHQDKVQAVAFSPDSKYVLTGSQDKTAKLWDVATGKEIRTFKYFDSVRGVAFSPDGKYALISSGKLAELWDISTGDEIRTFKGHSDFIYEIVFSPNGKYVLTGSQDKTAKLWDVTTGDEIRTFNGHSGTVWAVAFSPDGKYILTGSSDKTAKLWDVTTGDEVRSFSGSNEIYTVTFSPDGLKILTGGRDSKATLWNVSTGKSIQTLKHLDTIFAVAFSPDGKYILTGCGDRITRLWDAKTYEEIRAFKGHFDVISSVAFSTDGRYVLTGSWDKVAKVWTISDNLTRRIFTNPSLGVESIAFAPDGKYLLAGGFMDATLWDVSTGDEVRTFSGHSGWIEDVAFSPDGKYVLTGSADDSAKLWDVDTGDEIRTFNGHSDNITSVAFSPDGKYVLTGSADDTAKLWVMSTGDEVRTFNGHSDNITSVAFSPDGKYVLTGSADYSAKLWNVDTGVEIRTIDGHSQSVFAVAFSPDGKFVLTGSIDGTAKLWETETRKEIRVFKGHSERVLTVAFSPDGKYVLTGSADNTAKLWDVTTGKNVRTLHGHTNFVKAVTFSPDGLFIATSSQDKTIRIWDVDYKNTMNLVCSLLTRDLTGEERAQYEISDDGPTCLDQQKKHIVLQPATSEYIKSLLRNGNILGALLLLSNAKEMDPAYVDKFDATLWNSFCWWGSLYGYAKDVTDACNKAVELDPENVWQDSRGLNNALLGNYASAIDDFKIAVEHFKKNNWKQDYITTREEWIKLLEAGQNPFDAEMIEQLKYE